MGASAKLLPLRKLAQSIEEYLAQHPAAALLEDGRVLFDMRSARYSVSESHGRCLLQFWSDERNLMRTVVEVRSSARNALRLMTRRMGASKPQALELVPSSDRRTPTTRDAATAQLPAAARTRLDPRLHRFEGGSASRSAMDLEHSFGPAYVRGRLLRGTAADAVIGVSAAESASTDRWHSHARAFSGSTTAASAAAKDAVTLAASK